MGKGERGKGKGVVAPLYLEDAFFIWASGVKLRFVWFLAKVQFPLTAFGGAPLSRGAFSQKILRQLV